VGLLVYFKKRNKYAYCKPLRKINHAAEFFVS
jgi:hypothetical protein